MNLFETLLEIKTGKKKFMIKAVYLPDSIIWDKWTYFIYHFDLVSNAYYIDDLDWALRDKRVSLISVIDKVVTKAYKQEINAYGKVIKKILQTKKANIYYFYHQDNSRLLIIDTIKLQAIKNKHNETISFALPTAEKRRSQERK